MSLPSAPPASEQDLVNQAAKLSGQSLGQLAHQLGVSLPENPRHAKGWIGQLIELALGAQSGNLSQPDFPNLGIELKTLPLKNPTQPKESTFICTIPLLDIGKMVWQNSRVYQKLKKILWVPIEAQSDTPFSERYIGNAFIWSPNPTQEKILQSDWEEFAELILLGKLDSITAKQGTALQIRPKAAHSKILRNSINQQGQQTKTLPRGFYLRASFTRTLLCP